jgi:hypothetical protein
LGATAGLSSSEKLANGQANGHIQSLPDGASLGILLDSLGKRAPSYCGTQQPEEDCKRTMPGLLAMLEFH